jgi:peptide/nickel transport system substrate-binding protein
MKSLICGRERTVWFMNYKILFATCIVLLSILQVGMIGIAQQQKILVVAITDEPELTELNPVRMTTTYYTALAFPALVGWDKDGKVVPDLAESWEITPDGLTYTFHLRDGLKWSDGQALTSDDVLFTVELLTEQSEFWYYLWAPIQEAASDTVTGYTLKSGSVAAPDPKTVVMQLTAPSATFFINAAGWTVLPRHYFEGMDLVTQNPDLSTYVASGPFIPREKVPGDRLVYMANPNYYGGTPGLDQIIFKVFRDAAAAEIALQSGEVSLYPNVPGDDVPALEKVPSLQIGQEQNQINIYVTFNHHPKLADGSVNPVSDLGVRKAIAMALDLPTILSSSLGGYYKLANQIQVPNMFYLGKSVTNTSIPSPAYPYDPGAAAKLLDDAGYPADSSGLRMKISLVMASGGRTGSTPAIKIMQLIQSGLKAVGIQMDLIILEAASARQRIRLQAPPKDWNMALWSISSSPDPDTNAYFMVSTLGGNGGAGGWNVGGYYNPLVDELTMLGASTTDVEQRVAIYQRISGIAHEELAVLELYYQTEVLAWNKKFQGFVLGLGNPMHDYWGALKHQSLAQVTMVEETTTTATTTAPAAPGVDYMTIGAIAVVLVIVIGALAYFAGRRSKKS